MSFCPGEPDHGADLLPKREPLVDRDLRATGTIEFATREGSMFNEHDGRVTWLTFRRWQQLATTSVDAPRAFGMCAQF